LVYEDVPALKTRTCAGRGNAGLLENVSRQGWARDRKSVASVESVRQANPAALLGDLRDACGIAGGSANSRFCSTASRPFDPEAKTLAGTPLTGQGFGGGNRL